MSNEIVDPIIALYERVRSLAEKRLKNKWRVTKISAYSLDAEYYPTKEAYGELDPPTFFLGRIDMSFKVTAVRLPFTYKPDEADLTIELIQGELFVRKVVVTQRISSGWGVVELMQEEN